MEIHTRTASRADLTAITELAVQVAPQIPGSWYRCPYSHRYPKDTYDHTRLEYETYIEDTDDLWKWTAMVAEIKSIDDQHWKVIAVAVWEVSGLGAAKVLKLEQAEPSTSRIFTAQLIYQSMLINLSIGQNTNPNEVDNQPDTSTPTRRDHNPAHEKAWKETLDDARRKYLEPSGRVNGPLSYLHLQQLHTHPNYQYNGAGTALVNWGITLAQEHQLKIGLFASPMGEVLFRGMHFTKLASVVVQVEGETSRVIVNCMAL